MTRGVGRRGQAGWWAAGAAVWTLGCVASAAPPRSTVGRAASPPAVTFEHDVRPILKTYCFDCHGSEETLRGKLDVRLKRFLLRGGQAGPAIVPGRPADSLLLKRLRTGAMPPTEKKVPPEQIAVVERWIASGAAGLRQEPEKLPAGMDISPEDRAYWFYQPLRRPVPGAFRPADRVRTPIDAFVLARLREKGIAFAPDADRLTLLRRSAFDLTGLPPQPGDVADFLADGRPDAYERMVDRLLASPHYGERWGRHWLDVAGYADSDGNGNDDTPRPHAYRYRDYVIRALNADRPLDQFVTEQLAGDELVPRPWKNLTPEQLDTLAATGFLRMAVDATAGGETEPAANQVVTDTVKIVSSSLVGLTVGCAQCHDHKYDPISHEDYYRFRAIFEPALSPARWKRPNERLLSLYTDADRARAAEVDAAVQKLQAAFNEKQAAKVAEAFEKELLKHPEDQRERLRAAMLTPAGKRTPEQKQIAASNPSLNISPGVLYQYDPKAAEELNKEQATINARRAQRPPEQFVSILTEDPDVAPATHLFYRGDYRQPKQAVSPGDLTIAAPEGGRLDIPADDPKLPTTGRRLAWARTLTSGRHPLFNRVMANRIWLHHFGRGIVDTPGDFGKLGLRPSHADLLDWLAEELPRRRWSLKQMHRLIMTSTVYRQSAVVAAPVRAVDADGALYSRYPVRRLDAESLRDRILTTVGRLDRTQFGPPIAVAEDIVGQVEVANDTPRRSIYLQTRRTRPVSFLTAFDAPVMTVNCDRRQPTTGAPQALMLMNSDFILKQAGYFAERLRKETPGDLPQQVSRAWQLAYTRLVRHDELEAALRFVRSQQDRQLSAAGAQKPDDLAKAELAALTHLCQQLLSSNEFLYAD